MKIRQQQHIGRWGENYAEKYLAEKGFNVLERNFRTAYGEIDLIVQSGDLTLFVEVKTRTNDSFGNPETGMTYKKRQHLQRAAEAYIQDHSDLHGDWRIDLLAIHGKPGLIEPEVKWFENVGE